MTAPKKPDYKFDNAVLMAMQEPIMLRVDKLRGGGTQMARSQVPLPAGSFIEDASPGAGFSKDEILRLETWLVSEWSGGGFYEITATDSAGTNLTWRASYPPNLYPEKTPPPLAGAAVPAQVTPILSLQPQPLLAGQGAGGTYSVGVPTGQMQAPPAPQPILAPSRPTMLPTFQPRAYGPQDYAPSAPTQHNGGGNGGTQVSPPPPWYGFGRYRDDREDNDRADREAATERRIAAEREERIKREAALEKERIEERYRQELARQEAQRLADKKEAEHKAELAAVRDAVSQQIAALTEKLTARPAGESETAQLLAKIEADNRRRDEEQRRRDEEYRRERERDEERRRYEAEKAERDRREAELRREMEQQRRDFEAKLLAQQSTRNDPMIDMMREAMRTAGESQKDLQRLIQDTAARQSQAPFEIAKLLREAAAPPDAMIATMSRTFGTVMDAYDRIVHNAAQANSGSQPSTAMQLLQEGINAAKETIGGWFQGQNQAAAINARAQMSMADAQARTAEAQAAAIAAQAGKGQLAGAPMAQVPAAVPLTPAAPLPPGTVQAPLVKPPASDVPAPTPSDAQNKATEQEVKLFGPLYDHVMLMREKILAGQMHPGHVIGEFAVAIDGMNKARAAGMQIPEIPVMKLFFDGNFADFVDKVLGTKIPAQFRDICAQILGQTFRITQQGQIEVRQTPEVLAALANLDEEGEEGEDDGEDEGEDEDASKAPPKEF
jgi:hypothetical protein